ncbi:50S ribosomal protein L32e [Candidatus Woesearchaeota archaeon]|nr:50S ribosomal protein L32e [Candidatus Woesearchaeota archaeon]
MTELLRLRKAMKARQPSFERDESFKRKEIGSSWRRPRGNCNKCRKNIFGHPALVKKGYRAPRNVRGLLPSGLDPVMIYTLADLDTIDKNLQAAVIASSVGTRKRFTIYEECIKRNIIITNTKDPQGFLDRIAKVRRERKEALKKAEEAKKKKTVKKKQAKKEKKSEKKEEKEDSNKEKKELDKILTKKQ